MTAPRAADGRRNSTTNKQVRPVRYPYCRMTESRQSPFARDLPVRLVLSESGVRRLPRPLQGIPGANLSDPRVPLRPQSLDAPGLGARPIPFVRWRGFVAVAPGRLGAAARGCSTRPWPHDRPADATPGTASAPSRRCPQPTAAGPPAPSLAGMCSSTGVRPSLSGRGRPPNQQRGWSDPFRAQLGHSPECADSAATALAQTSSL
jgi:hypothetical protein